MTSTMRSASEVGSSFTLMKLARGQLSAVAASIFTLTMPMSSALDPPFHR
jgi:hypothetical protein